MGRRDEVPNQELAQQIDLRYVILSFNYFTIDHAKCLKSMKRFVRHVLPELREISVARSPV